MTNKLTIKDLNCGNCSGPCPVLFGSFFEGRESSDIANITKAVGCASHPLALQVLAGPVIEELEERNNNIGYPYFVSEWGMLKGRSEAIKLLKEGVKEP